MQKFLIYERFKKYGTLSDEKRPEPRFALCSTLHWMKALSILVKYYDLDFKKSKNFYEQKGICSHKKYEEKVINTIYEQLIFTLHQISALRSLSFCKHKSDIVRISIITWYYGIYGAASAMTVCSDSSFQENHTATARHWDHQLAAKGLIMQPFDQRLSSILEKNIEEKKSEISLLGKSPLTKEPKSISDAWGCISEYLSGCAHWKQEKCNENIIKNKEFRDLGFSNFRTKKSRIIRDKEYSKKSLSFLHQAFRYRGKANYRDAIFLAYGKKIEHQLNDFVSDLSSVLESFAAMSAAYCAIRLGSNYWSQFFNDVDLNGSLSVKISSLWSES